MSECKICLKASRRKMLVHCAIEYKYDQCSVGSITENVCFWSQGWGYCYFLSVIDKTWSQNFLVTKWNSFDIIAISRWSF